LSQLEQDTFAKSCVFSSCHKGPSGAGGLNLESPTHGKLVNKASSVVATKILVVPGNADASYLIQKLEQAKPAAGERMPPSAELEPDRIARIRSWIAAGAVNN
jgi:hypothetical protein